MNKDKKNDGGVILCGPDAEGGGQHCLRLSSAGTEVGVLEPFNGFANLPPGAQIVQGHRRGPIVMVDDISDPIKGPPRVTSNAYRTGWDNIWNKEVGQA